MCSKIQSLHNTKHLKLFKSMKCGKKSLKMLKDHCEYVQFLAESGNLAQSLSLLYSLSKYYSELKIEDVLPIIPVLFQYTKSISEQYHFQRNELSCQACNGVLFEPVILTCGHSYCKICYVDVVVCFCGHKLTQKDIGLSCSVSVSVIVENLWNNELEGAKFGVEAMKHLPDKPQIAMELCTKGLSIVPADHILLTIRSSVHVLLENYERAVQDANNAIYIQPTWYKAYYWKAVSLLYLSHFEETFINLLIYMAFMKKQHSVDTQDEIAKILIELLRKWRRHMNQAQTSFNASSLQSDGDNSPEEDDSDYLKCRSRRISRNSNSFDHFDCSAVFDKMLKTFEKEIISISESCPQYKRSLEGGKLTSNDFECSLCCQFMWMPVTTRCGHSYCKDCLNRCLDHSSLCPLCKSSISVCLEEDCKNTTEFLDYACRTLYPSEYIKRKMIHDNEITIRIDEDHNIPIFVATVSLPQVSYSLHVFEPRYRLMIRRCLESGSRQFGMCLPSKNEELGYCIYGTVLEIIDIVYTPDGRSILNTNGVRRFICVSRGMCDGYNTAKVKFFQDERTEHFCEIVYLHNAVYELATSWYQNIPDSKKAKILAHYGDMPLPEENYLMLPNGPSWLWYIIAIGPISGFNKVLMLKTISFKDRLLFVKETLEQISMS